MAARSDKPKLTLPPGLSPAEEARWWDEHPDYWDTVESEDEVLPPQPVRRTEAVNLRLPVDLIEVLKAEAAKRGMSHQALIRLWLEQRLDAESASPKKPDTR
jgi:hypothetical protein